MLYITDFHNTLNYDEIRKAGRYYDRFHAIQSNDTLTLEGRDSLGLFWKDKKFKNITVGYSRVPMSRKVEFDEAISSVKSKTKN